jgi:putative Ca2+/H+ antiporter (TMEM165/GDT1 family)
VTGHVFTIVYASVLAAEVLGDKLLYTTGVLATRYRTVPMMCGIAVACMAKMGIAVAVGQGLAALPPAVVAVMTAASFCWIASRFWTEGEPDTDVVAVHSAPEAAIVSFASVFFTEWGDVGQLTTATLAVQLRAPMIVWAAAATAMITKGALAATLGATIRPWVVRLASRRAVRMGGLALVIAMGVLSVVETLNRVH